MYAGRRDGLGGRLMPLLNAARIAHHLNGRLQFSWKSLQERHYSEADEGPAKLWSQRLISDCLVNDTKNCIDLEEFTIGRKIVNGITVKRVSSEKLLAATSPVQIEDWRSLYLLQGESLQSALAFHLEWLTHKAFNEKMLELYNTVIKQLPAFGRGIHVRLGDVAESPWMQMRHFSKKFAPVGFYEDLLSTESVKKNHSLICTNDNRLRSRCVAKGFHAISSEGLVPLQIAMMEILALSKCKKIYGSSKSAFLICARCLGKAEFHDVTDLFSSGKSHIMRQMVRDLYKPLQKELLDEISHDKITSQLLIIKGIPDQKTRDLAAGMFRDKFVSIRSRVGRGTWKSFHEQLYNTLASDPKILADFCLLLKGGDLGFNKPS